VLSLFQGEIMFNKLNTYKDEINTMAIVALTVTLIVVARRSKVVTDVMLADNSIVVEYSNGGMNMYDLD